jgi:hypothetical protein
VRKREGYESHDTRGTVIKERRFNRLYGQRSKEKKKKKKKSWAEAIYLSAVARKRTWPIIVHGVKMENYQLDAWEEHTRRIEKKNAKLALNLRI